MIVVRFTPTAVQCQAASVSATVSGLSVDVSSDDGATWHPAALHCVKDDWTAAVNQPGSGFVSLRACATGSAGNSVEQTIIHAYGLK